MTVTRSLPFNFPKRPYVPSSELRFRDMIQSVRLFAAIVEQWPFRHSGTEGNLDLRRNSLPLVHDQNVSAPQYDRSLDLPKSNREVLVLSDLVLPPTWVSIDFSRPQFLRTQLLSAQWHPPNMNVNDFHWHPATWCLLESMPQWMGQPVQEFAFFTDGSHRRDTNTAVAAVVLIVICNGQPHFGGFRVFRCWGRLNALRAERIALLGACGWAFQLSEHFEVPKHTIFSFVAGWTTEGSWQDRKSVV